MLCARGMLFGVSGLLLCINCYCYYAVWSSQAASVSLGQFVPLSSDEEKAQLHTPGPAARAQARPGAGALVQAQHEHGSKERPTSRHGLTKRPARPPTGSAPLEVSPARARSRSADARAREASRSGSEPAPPGVSGFRLQQVVSGNNTYLELS